MTRRGRFLDWEELGEALYMHILYDDADARSRELVDPTFQNSPDQGPPPLTRGMAVDVTVAAQLLGHSVVVAIALA